MSLQSTVPLYETFDAYDRFVNWERRLALELPFIERQLGLVDARLPSEQVCPPGPLRVLDVACGTGKHAIALAQRGYDVTGVDLSPAMIERARANARAAGIDDVRFLVAGFGLLVRRTQADIAHRSACDRREFDALLCLGNSLPHVLTEEALHTTLVDMAAVLRPGGLLFVQTRNMDAVLDRGARWMPLQARREGASVQGDGHEWLFVRFYDFHQDGSLTFNVVTLEREGKGPWRQRADATRLYPWRRDQLVETVEAAGFDDIRCYGDMTGAPYDRESSGNLVLTARRQVGQGSFGWCVTGTARQEMR
jgi:SAM-dependent methyltransferase